MLQEPRRVPPSADGGRGSNRVFRRRVRRKTHFPGRKCANREPKQSPAKRVCLGEKGQGSGVNPGRQAGANGADFDPTKCAQRPASPRKNACIFEKRVEVFRHAETACGGFHRLFFCSLILLFGIIQPRWAPATSLRRPDWSQNSGAPVPGPGSVPAPT